MDGRVRSDTVRVPRVIRELIETAVVDNDESVRVTKVARIGSVWVDPKVHKWGQVGKGAIRRRPWNIRLERSCFGPKCPLSGPNYGAAFPSGEKSKDPRGTAADVLQY